MALTAILFANALSAAQPQSTTASGMRLTCDADSTVRIEVDNIVPDTEWPENVIPRPEPGPTSDISELLANRTADCTAGEHQVRARISWFDEQWAGWPDRDSATFVRLWIDHHPLNLVLRIQDQEDISARINVRTEHAKACRTTISENHRKMRHCFDARFARGPIDEVEFAPMSSFPGPHHDIFVVEAKDQALCTSFAAYFEGGPAPAKLTMPRTLPSPDAWKSWNDTSYQLDADNDGEVDDVAVIDIEQYMLHGTVIAVFKRDSVLTGRESAPWWGDLMGIAMNLGTAKPQWPPALKAAVWAGPLGLVGHNQIRLHVVDGKTYAQITPEWNASYRSMMQNDRTDMRPIERARTDTRYKEIVVRTLPDMKAEPVCIFTRRSRNFE